MLKNMNNQESIGKNEAISFDTAPLFFHEFNPTLEPSTVRI